MASFAKTKLWGAGEGSTPNCLTPISLSRNRRLVRSRLVPISRTVSSLSRPGLWGRPHSPNRRHTRVGRGPARNPFADSGLPEVLNARLRRMNTPRRVGPTDVEPGIPSLPEVTSQLPILSDIQLREGGSTLSRRFAGLYLESAQPDSGSQLENSASKTTLPTQFPCRDP